MISSIRLQDFRSYHNDAFEFEDSVNIVVGPNACGKTNLLEAILVLCRGSSYRAKDIELISFDKPWARLEGTSDGHPRIVKLKQDKNPTKEFEIDGKKYLRLSASTRSPVVLFEPNHLQLLTGSPELRRNYLDDLLEQIVSGYSGVKRRYLRSLAQRNALLKTPGNNVKDILFPWNIRISQLAGQIVKYRSELVDSLNEILPSIYDDLAGSTTKVELVYKPQLPVKDYESHHLSSLDKSVEDDLRSGFTSYGPHRDDFNFIYNSHQANLSASRGEMRTGVLALKIAEIDIIKKTINKNPVFLLDDVFSELDGHRRHALTQRLGGIQSFITTTDADIVINELASRCNVLALT
ncbi:MAG TPA: DNA replication and repair protein RecF [Candidatus Saccharimonadales bacterium]